MQKKAKKIICLILTIFNALTEINVQVHADESVPPYVDTTANAAADTIYESNIWDFTTDSSIPVGSLSNPEIVTYNIEHNGITLKASVSKPVYFSSHCIEADPADGKYKTRLSLGGQGSNTARSFKFYVNGPTDIYITAKSPLYHYSSNPTGDDIRNLILSEDLSSSEYIDIKQIIFW